MKILLNALNINRFCSFKFNVFVGIFKWKILSIHFILKSKMNLKTHLIKDICSNLLFFLFHFIGPIPCTKD